MVTITSSTLISNSLIFLRNLVISKVTDPITSKRPTRESFVMTSYPRKTITYPIITLKATNAKDVRLGHQSEKTLVTFTIEMRVWARNEKEKNNLYDSVYDAIRTNQFDSGGTIGTDLVDQKLLSAVEVDDPGEEGIKSRILQWSYSFITT